MQKETSASTEVRMMSELEARYYTGLGRSKTREFCESIGAVIRIGRRRLYDKKVIDEYFDSLHKKPEGE